MPPFISLHLSLTPPLHPFSLSGSHGESAIENLHMIVINDFDLFAPALPSLRHSFALDVLGAAACSQEAWTSSLTKSNQRVILFHLFDLKCRGVTAQYTLHSAASGEVFWHKKLSFLIHMSKQLHQLWVTYVGPCSAFDSLPNSVHYTALVCITALNKHWTRRRWTGNPLIAQH